MKVRHWAWGSTPHVTAAAGRRGWVSLSLAVLLTATLADWVPSPARAEPAPTPMVEPGGLLDRPDESAALVTARMTGKKVRILDATTEFATAVANPDGTVTFESAVEPQRARMGDGSWKDLNLSLVTAPDGVLRPAVSVADVKFSPGGDRPLVELRSAGKSMTLTWQGALPKPVVEGASATYPEVVPGVDLVARATTTGFSHVWVIKTPEAARTSAGRLNLQLGGDAQVATAGDGSLRATDAGRTLATAPAAVMWDSAQPLLWQPGDDTLTGSDRTVGRPQPDPGAQRSSATTAGDGAKVGGVQTRVNGGRLELTPDEAMLASAETVYPVYVDPSWTVTSSKWAYSNSINSNWDLGGYAWVGQNSFDSALYRSYFDFDTSAIKGKYVQSAQVTARLWHSWACEPTWTHLYRTSGITVASGARMAWSTRPLPSGVWLDSAEGNANKSGGCGANQPDMTMTWEGASLTTDVRQAANNGSSLYTVGMCACNEAGEYETTQNRWKKFYTNQTKLIVTYTSYPTVGSRVTVPSTSCVTGSNLPYVNTTTPKLQAQINDAEGSQVRAKFEWLTGGGTSLGAATVGPAAAGSWQSATVPAGVFTENGTYSWRVQGNDGVVDGPWTGYCAFIVDTTAPSTLPTVSSTDYPTNDWAGDAGTAGSFTFGANGTADIAAYEYGLNVNPPDKSVTTSSLGANATASITPSTVGPQVLYVRSRDRAGNVSAIQTYSFSVGVGVGGAVTSPKEGDITAAKAALTATGKATATSVTYQWRRADVDAWTDIPTGHVTLAAGGGPVTWPVTTTGNGEFAKINWDVEATLAAADAQSVPRDGPLQVRAVFSTGTSPAIKISFDRTLATAPAEAIGPGAVNLITGNFTLTDTDVAASSFESSLVVSRSYNTRRATDTDTANMFGPGWVSSVEVERADSPYTSLHVYGSLVQVGTREGNTIGFTARSTSSYDAEIGHESLKLVYASANDAYTLTNSDGSVVVFTRLAGTAAGAYFPTSVTVPAGQITTLSWEKVTIGNQEVIRPTRLLAAVAEGVTCVTVTRGCRAVNFTYATTTTATGTTESAWGDHVGRLQEVSFTAWDPDLTTPAVRTVTMARYTYDNTGKLRAVWDPRLDWNDSGTL
ncbi:hypothetical protein GCM10027290_50980 [Micromonospora sonneratiae]